MEIRIVGSNEAGVHVGKLGRLLLALSNGQKIEQVTEPEPAFGPTEWKFGRGIPSGHLNVTAKCARCNQGYAVYSLTVLADGWFHCGKVEHAPENFATQWKEQDAFDRREAIEREEQLLQRKQDDERSRARFIETLS
jgi:hypothetical protein